MISPWKLPGAMKNCFQINSNKGQFLLIPLKLRTITVIGYGNYQIFLEVHLVL